MENGERRSLYSFLRDLQEGKSTLPLRNLIPLLQRFGAFSKVQSRYPGEWNRCASRYIDYFHYVVSTMSRKGNFPLKYASPSCSALLKL